MTTRPTMTPLDWALLALLSGLWGGSFFFVEIVLRDLDPLTLVAARVTLAALSLWLWRAWRRTPALARAVWPSFVVLGLLNNAVPFSLLAYGQVTLASGLAAVLNATTPLFTALIAGVALTDERLNVPTVVGVLLGFAGVAVMMGADALSGLGSDVLAQAACIGAALSYGCAAVFARRFKRMGVAPLDIATGQLTCSAAIMIAVAALFGTSGMWLAVEGWAALVLLGTASTSVAYLLFFRIIASAGATNASLVTFLVPVTAILLGTLVLGERLTPAEIGGMALIVVGLIVLDGRWRRLLPRA